MNKLLGHKAAGLTEEMNAKFELPAQDGTKVPDLKLGVQKGSM